MAEPHPNTPELTNPSSTSQSGEHRSPEHIRSNSTSSFRTIIRSPAPVTVDSIRNTNEYVEVSSTSRSQTGDSSASKHRRRESSVYLPVTTAVPAGSFTEMGDRRNTEDSVDVYGGSHSGGEGLKEARRESVSSFGTMIRSPAPVTGNSISEMAESTHSVSQQGSSSTARRDASSHINTPAASTIQPRIPCTPPPKPTSPAPTSSSSSVRRIFLADPAPTTSPRRADEASVSDNESFYSATEDPISPPVERFKALSITIPPPLSLSSPRTPTQRNRLALRIDTTPTRFGTAATRAPLTINTPKTRSTEPFPLFSTSGPDPFSTSSHARASSASHRASSPPLHHTSPRSSSSSGSSSSNSSEASIPRADPEWPRALSNFIRTLRFPWIDSQLRVTAKYLRPRLPEFELDRKDGGLRLLGRGGTSNVFTPLPPSTPGFRRWDGGGGGRAMAIKKYKTPDLARNFYREIEIELRILDQLQHAHVVSLLGAFKQENIVGVLLAEVAVCDLEDFLDSFIAAAEMTPGLWRAFEFEGEGRGDEERHQRGAGTVLESGVPYEREDWNGTREVQDKQEAEAQKAHAWLLSHTACLASALEYIHALHISHNDIRIENVLLTPTRLLLCDFGGSEDLKLNPPPMPPAWRTGSGLGLALLEIEAEKAMTKLLEKDVLMLSAVFFEMALARDYEARAVEVQGWEAMCRERGGEALKAWVGNLRALKGHFGVGKVRGVRWNGSEGAEGAILRLVEGMAELFAKGELSAEGVRGLMEGDKGAKAFLRRGCCTAVQEGRGNRDTDE
ncbi:hypothetical protein MMC30_001675 [Trapelia coarctata]|nr:hypothetical protein [Trapelia coarctata]